MPTVLIVEDNAMNSDMLSRRLIRRGYEVLLAVDGESGVATAQSSKPDLILMDMTLPEMTGWDATRMLKADQVTCRIPVIALTAHAGASDREAALAAGCDEFETKPVELSQLLVKMESLIQRYGTGTGS